MLSCYVIEKLHIIHSSGLGPFPTSSDVAMSPAAVGHFVGRSGDGQPPRFNSQLAAARQDMVWKSTDNWAKPNTVLGNFESLNLADNWKSPAGTIFYFTKKRGWNDLCVDPLKYCV